MPRHQNNNSRQRGSGRNRGGHQRQIQPRHPIHQYSGPRSCSTQDPYGTGFGSGHDEHQNYNPSQESLERVLFRESELRLNSAASSPRSSAPDMVSMPLSSNNLATLDPRLPVQPTQSSFRTKLPPQSASAIVQPQGQNSVGGISAEVVARMLENQAQRGVASGPSRESRSTPSIGGPQPQDGRLHPRVVEALKIARVATMYAEPFKPPPSNALCNRCGAYIKTLDQFYDLPCEHRFHMECLEQIWDRVPQRNPGICPACGVSPPFLGKGGWPHAKPWKTSE
ncbi:hypothetical protein EV356DRAFT_513841 [Viridothelium virens]|uniref:RING-type domain-containing protein n=1 Tax=Viridothelium virens TaxID=1048519 RepID=A0A6A6HN70_VIRVR|nr:hypothetical protein EV356DRAFT_513841 [Viridothelium virens]